MKITSEQMNEFVDYLFETPPYKAQFIYSNKEGFKKILKEFFERFIRTFYKKENNNKSTCNKNEVEIIDISNIKKDKITFEIFVNSDIEFIEISINDREGHHKKSNMIIHPRIDFKEVKSLDSLDEIVLIDDKISILNNYNLTLRESLHD